MGTLAAVVPENPLPVNVQEIWRVPEPLVPPTVQAALS
jgi:hypothetical protein